MPESAAKVVIVAGMPADPSSHDYPCRELEPGGGESEGQAVTRGTVGGPFPVAVGPGSPPLGAYLVARRVGGRWEATYQ